MVLLNEWSQIDKAQILTKDALDCSVLQAIFVIIISTMDEEFQ